MIFTHSVSMHDITRVVLTQLIHPLRMIVEAYCTLVLTTGLGPRFRAPCWSPLGPPSAESHVLRTQAGTTFSLRQ